MSRRDRALFVGLAVLLVALSLLSNSSARRDARDLRASSYLSSSGGTAALFLTLEELGLEPQRRLAAYVGDDSLAGPLALIAPSEAPTPAELHALATWVRAGGTLLYAARRDDPTLDTLGIELASTAPDSLSPAERRLWEGTFALPEPHPLTEGVSGAAGFRYSLELAEDAPVEPLLTSGDGALLAAQIPLGRGRVVAFADAQPLVNAYVGEGGAAVVFARAAALNGDELFFDEYHHGFRAGGNAAVATMRYLRDTRLGHALLQLGVVALGLLLLAGTRFGSPVPPPPARRRDPLEHVGALAEAYRRAGARKTARRLLLHGLLRRLGRPVAGAETEQVFETLRRATPPRAHESVDALATEWAKGGSASLVTLARHMDRIVLETRNHR